MLIRKPDTDYWLIVAELDDAVVWEVDGLLADAGAPIEDFCDEALVAYKEASDRDREKLSRYYQTLDPGVLSIYGIATRWQIRPPSLRALMGTLHKHGINLDEAGDTPDAATLISSAAAAFDIALSAVTAVQDYGEFSGAVDAAWLKANVAERVLITLGQLILQRCVLSEADLGN